MTEINHIVLEKDTIESISAKYQVPLQWLKESNGIIQNRISEGDVLRITFPTSFNTEVVVFTPLHELVFQKGVLRLEEHFLVFDSLEIPNYHLKIDLPSHIECSLIDAGELFTEYKKNKPSDHALAVTYYKNPPKERAVISAFFCGLPNDLNKIKDEINKRFPNRTLASNMGLKHSNSLSFNLLTLNGKSTIIGKKIAEEIRECLPTRLSHTSKLTLLYQMSRDGCSYDTMYKKIAKSSPILFFIKTSTNEKIGFFFSGGLYSTSDSYGYGDTIIFQVRPKFQAYYSKKNADSFICSTYTQFILGGESKSAIWIDENLYQGISEPCPTFNSPQLVSSLSFIIIDIEIWKLS